MRRYELSLSENYVSNWGVVEAVREIFQNALDQEVQAKNDYREKNYYYGEESNDPLANPNKMFYSFSGESLMVGNKSSVLNVKSLLLGETTKKEDNTTIGKFGEGYKLALLVLARLGKPVKIYNYGAREVWEAKLRNSPKYQGAKTLQIEVQDKYIWQKVPDNNLTYVIGGLTQQEKMQIMESNLNLQEPDSIIQTSYGQILTSSKQQGRLYVSGLFIQYNEHLAYGYNFKPEHIELDRDRRMIGHFDLTWKTSQMWKECGDSRIIEMCQNKKDDVQYLKNAWTSTSAGTNNYGNVANIAYQMFKADYGDEAVPVTTQREMEEVLRKHGGPKKVKPVVVYETYQTLLNASDDFQEFKKEHIVDDLTEILEPSQLMWNFYETVRDQLSGTELNTLWSLCLMSMNWREKNR